MFTNRFHPWNVMRVNQFGLPVESLPVESRMVEPTWQFGKARLWPPSWFS